MVTQVPIPSREETWNAPFPPLKSMTRLRTLDTP